MDGVQVGNNDLFKNLLCSKIYQAETLIFDKGMPISFIYVTGKYPIVWKKKNLSGCDKLQSKWNLKILYHLQYITQVIWILRTPLNKFLALLFLQILHSHPVFSILSENISHLKKGLIFHSYCNNIKAKQAHLDHW